MAEAETATAKAEATLASAVETDIAGGRFAAALEQSNPEAGEVLDVTPGRQDPCSADSSLHDPDVIGVSEFSRLLFHLVWLYL